MELMNDFETKITPWKNNCKAALTLSFDGGYSISYNLAMELLLRYKMPATWFIVTGCIGGNLEGRPVVNWEELKKVSSDMEIASHTVTHPQLMLSFSSQIYKKARSLIKKPQKLLALDVASKARRAISGTFEKCQREVDYKVILSEAIESKTIIEHYLDERQVVSFAYPGGRYNSKLKKNIREVGYLSARSTEDGYNFPDSLDFYALKSKVWNATVNADEPNRWVDFAIEKNAWLTETYHVVSQDGATGYYYDTAVSDFDSHLAYIDSQHIWVDTQENISKYVKESKVTKIKSIVISSKRVVLSAKNSLDPSIYDQSLTLKSNIPRTWTNVRIIQAENIQEVSPVEEGGQRYIYYNILPNKGEITIIPL